MHYFIQTLVQIAHTLEIQVIAEQVESEEQYQQLRDCHIDGFQGYLIDVPRQIFNQAASTQSSNHNNETSPEAKAAPSWQILPKAL